MANYSLILDTKFKPFSYAEMLAPVAAATQAHQAIEEEYENLATKASVWDRMANEQTDPEAYRMYKTYSDDLEARAEQLMRYGLNASSRKGMLDMRARYSKEIVPIETAYKRREELAAEQRKALAQNPTMLYQRMAETMSLDDFIKNPSLDYGHQYSGALITQQVANAAANLAKEAQDSEEGKRRLRKILPYQYELIRDSKFNSEAVMKAILNSPDADKILTGLVENAISSSGVKEWGDAATLRRAYDYARQGLYSAIGKTQYQMVTDQYNLEIAREQREIARKKAEKEAEDKEKLLRAYKLNSTRLLSKSDIASANKATLEELDKWKNKGYVTSGGKLTKSGWDAIRNQLLYEASGKAESKSPYARARAYTGRDEAFTKWATEHGIKYTMPQRVENLNAQGQSFYTYTDPVLQGYGNITNYYNSMRQRAASGELVTGVANIKVLRNRVSSSEGTQKDLIDLISSTNSPIYSAGALQADGTIKQGEMVSIDDFKELAKKSPIKHLINSPIKNQQLVELSNGQKFFLPKSIFGDSVVDPWEGKGDLDKANYIIANSPEYSDDSLVASAYASAYLSSILDNTSGENIAYHGSITEEELQ